MYNLFPIYVNVNVSGPLLLPTWNVHVCMNTSRSNWVFAQSSLLFNFLQTETKSSNEQELFMNCVLRFLQCETDQLQWRVHNCLTPWKMCFCSNVQYFGGLCVCTVAAHVHNEYSRKSAITGLYVLAAKNNSNNRKCYKRRFSLRPEKVGSCFLNLKVSYIANIVAAKLT